MTGIEERVKGFIESWEKIRDSDLLSPGPLHCVVCDRELEDGNFIILDGDALCLPCKDSIR